MMASNGKKELCLEETNGKMLVRTTFAWVTTRTEINNPAFSGG